MQHVTKIRQIYKEKNMKEEITYKMVYRQRVYKNDKFPNQRIQQLGEGPVTLEWPDGSAVTEDQSDKNEDTWVQTERTVTPFKP